jgi:hypothetical protein
MADIIFVAASVVFFAASFGLVHLFDKLEERK